MEIVYSVAGLREYLDRVGGEPGRTIYLDRFLEDSIEVDVDALCDGSDVWIAGIMQHVEEAGIHSGDSACVLPPHTLGDDMLEQIRAQTKGSPGRSELSACSTSSSPSTASRACT